MNDDASPWNEIREEVVQKRIVDLPRLVQVEEDDERKLLYTLAREYASEGGAIADAGCFLGGSTVALLAGFAIGRGAVPSRKLRQVPGRGVHHSAVLCR